MRGPRPCVLQEQLSLFEPPRVRPRWQDLPCAIRRDVVALMAQMLREHWMRHLPAAKGKEAADE
jgi:hypothetical protein